MNFLAKSILNKEQLDAKIAVGGKDTHFELQLLHELASYAEVWNALNLSLLDDYTFDTVHSNMSFDMIDRFDAIGRQQQLWQRKWRLERLA